jgi:hypothetical protein
MKLRALLELLSGDSKEEELDNEVWLRFDASDVKVTGISWDGDRGETYIHARKIKGR